MTYPNRPVPVTWEQISAANQPRPPRGRTGLIVAVVVLAVLAVGVVTAVVVLAAARGRAADPAVAASPAASSAPSTPAPAFDERSACMVLIPLLARGANLVQSVIDHPDGSTVDRGELERILRELRSLVDRVPASMRGDLQAQVDTFADIHAVFFGAAGGHTLQLERYRTSGITLATGCREYATG